MAKKKYHFGVRIGAPLVLCLQSFSVQAADKQEQSESPTETTGIIAESGREPASGATIIDEQVEQMKASNSSGLGSEFASSESDPMTPSSPEHEGSAKDKGEVSDGDSRLLDSPDVETSALPLEIKKEPRKLRLRWGCALDDKHVCGKSALPQPSAEPPSKSFVLPFDLMIGAGLGLSTFLHINTVGTENANFRGVSAFGPLLGVLDLAARFQVHQIGVRVFTGGLVNFGQVSAAVPTSLGVSLRYAYLFSRRSFRPYLGGSFGYARFASALRVVGDDFWTTRVHQSLHGSLLPGFELGQSSGISFYAEGDFGLVFSQNTAAIFGANLGARYSF